MTKTKQPGKKMAKKSLVTIILQIVSALLITLAVFFGVSMLMVTAMVAGM